MNIQIRQETSEDYKTVFDLIEQAFLKEPMSDHQEQFLVERLRKSADFIPELSLVAEVENQVVGHIILSKIEIKNASDSYPSLALAPVSVLPRFHKKGIGGLLIKKAHEVAKELGFTSVILLGHDTYYPRFGYQQAHTFGIEFPFNIPKQFCMAIELVENGLKNKSGEVVYPPAFF